jgi:hypothetical protein
MDEIAKIKNLIAQARMEQALDELEKIAPSTEKSTVVILKSNLAGLKRDKNLGIITPEESNMRNARITVAALGLCDDIEKLLAEEVAEATSVPNGATQARTETSNTTRNISPPPGGWPNVPLEPFDGQISVPKGSNGNTKVLFASASPQNQRPLAVDKESKFVQLEAQGRDLDIIVCPHTDRDSLIKMVTFEQPQIVHFSGHGTTGGLETIDPRTDNSILLPNDDLVDMFSLFKDYGVKCVVLCSCWSAEQAKEISTLSIPVVGMLQPIDDDVAIKFSRDLYYLLVSNNPLNNIFKSARLMVDKESRHIPSLWLDGKRIA